MDHPELVEFLKHFSELWHFQQKTHNLDRLFKRFKFSVSVLSFERNLGV